VSAIPTIDPAQHRAEVGTGLVERPLIFTWDDLRRFPSGVEHSLSRMLGPTPVQQKPTAKETGHRPEWVW